MKYRRSRAKGAKFFFTVVTYKRERVLCSKENITLIKEAFTHVASQRPFNSDAFVLLPDHIHCIWTLPENDCDFSTRWRLIKKYFSMKYNKRNLMSDCKHDDNKESIWQNRFWEHQIRDEDDFIKHVEYIHYNPVKHGLVKSPKDWEYSTFHRYVSQGLYDINWGETDDIKFEKTIGKE